ncbi:MAG: YidC/Oxa1 family membrane protein insertase [Synergistaceae bacterium]|nr:YidC/Oxa1 family membrane protein insertase [Synergistaceae bacterium]
MGAIWSGAGQLLTSLLNLFYTWTGSYGLAIIFLTIVVRLAIHPLNQKQLKSMQQMQLIQPRMKVIQEKYASDKERMNKELLKLYQDHHINPAAGCLPLLIQIPILILLFKVLREFDFGGNATFLTLGLNTSVNQGLGSALGIPAGQEGFFLIIKSLFENPSALAKFSLYLPNLILLLAICYLTWLQSNMSAKGNEQMATMNTIMPIMMGFICLSMPGGVMLYWGVSSLWGVVQQYLITKKTKEQMAIKPTLYKNKPTGNNDELYDDDDDEYEDDEDEYEDDYEYEDDEEESEDKR